MTHSTLYSWLFWFGTDWHWAMVLAGIALLLLFGVVGVVVDSDGDWFIF